MRLSALLTIVVFTLFMQPLHADIKGKKKIEKKKKIELTDTYWRLSEYNGKPLPPVNDNSTPYIYLKHKGRKLVGHTGCNEIGGEYGSGKYDYVGFEPTYTEMPCAQQQLEQYMQTILKQANKYEVTGNNLLLYNDNMLLGVFEAQ
jgi:heat shock protein HslJ